MTINDCALMKNIPILAKYLTTLQETSKDNHNNTAIYMTNSNLEVVNFDLVKNEYCKNLGLDNVASSVDALFFKEENIYFIEFKNGRIEKNEVVKKMYDSLLMFSDISQKDISYFRKHLHFILVYNDEKVKEDDFVLRQKHHIQESYNRSFINSHIKIKNKYDFAKYQELYFKSVNMKTSNELIPFLIQ